LVKKIINDAPSIRFCSAGRALAFGLDIAGSFPAVNRSALGAIAERSLSFQVTSEKFLEKFHFLIA
jgi:hypothetical protein